MQHLETLAGSPIIHIVMAAEKHPDTTPAILRDTNLDLIALAICFSKLDKSIIAIFNFVAE
jgi:hypothetical protein